MFTSRIDRLGFILGHIYLTLPVVVVIILYAFISYSSATNASGGGLSPVNSEMNVILFLIGLVAIVAYFPISISLMVRRWHDVNQTGWLTILSFIPTVGFIVFIIQMLLKGTDGPNNYGPLSSPRGFVEVLLGHKTVVSDVPMQQPATIVHPAITNPVDTATPIPVVPSPVSDQVLQTPPKAPVVVTIPQDQSLAPTSSPVPQQSTDVQPQSQSQGSINPDTTIYAQPTVPAGIDNEPSSDKKL